jgi:hypothetical protein
LFEEVGVEGCSESFERTFSRKKLQYFVHRAFGLTVLFCWDKMSGVKKPKVADSSSKLDGIQKQVKQVSPSLSLNIQ